MNKKAKAILSRDTLIKMLSYDPETGGFTWIVKAANRIVVGAPAGTLKKSGYVDVKIKGRLHKAHRLAWLWSHGYLPEGEIDHINGDKSDNRIANLREVSRQCNSTNKHKYRSNTSGVTGVYKRRPGVWAAQIRVEGKCIHLGYHRSMVSAAKARLDAEIKHQFPRCKTRSTASEFINQKEDGNV